MTRNVATDDGHTRPWRGVPFFSTKHDEPTGTYGQPDHAAVSHEPAAAAAARAASGDDDDDGRRRGAVSLEPASLAAAAAPPPAPRQAVAAPTS